MINTAQKGPPAKKLFQTTLIGVRTDMMAQGRNLQEGFKYIRPFFILRSQSTFLSSLLQHIDSLGGSMSMTEKAQLKNLKKSIKNLQECKFGHLLDTANEVIVSVRSIISTKNLTERVDRCSSLLLKSALSIRQISTMLDARTRSDNEYEKVKEQQFQINSPTKPDGSILIPEDDQNMFICRICEEKIPIDKIETHTKFCIQGYMSHKCKAQILATIDQIYNDIVNKELKVNWPQSQDIMVSYHFPLLHMSLILQHVKHLDFSQPDARETLELLHVVLKYLQSGDKIRPILNKCINAIRECIRICKAMSTASAGLSDTRISKNPKPITFQNVTIADFEFIRRISSGAFATVFIAKKKLTGDIFAIKVIPRTTVIQKNQTSRIMTEKDILKNFTNPYIVTFYYSILGERNLYLVTEFVPGGDLYSLLQALGSFDEDSSKIYIAEILHALRYLRENGIIHRDLKPDNILVTKNGTLKLTDFGLSHQGIVNRQMSNEPEDIEAEPEIVGTLDYMAPEILMNLPHSFGVDYWSLGAMLFEFLTGVPPFHADTDTETTKNILLNKIDFQPDDEMSPEAKDLIKRLLDPNPETRLGVKDINDIFKNPWLKGINPETAEPPFKPQLKSSTDTHLFEERYHFSPLNDQDILHDISVASSPQTSVSKFNLDDIEEEKSLSDFQSIGVDNLIDQNMNMAKRLKSSSFTSDDLELPHENHTQKGTKKRALSTNFEPSKFNLV
ncbi:AGC family protein kinase [Trichomonas vaginalis G3]|uniref:non-specific serine/threonine protein kinase n=1 Tax=Trichomonas vaginalis (strain ATCC PRA-98 / G3) TaxID=412133 RepID=A2F8E8_TRIV3|nr:STKc MAST like domain-containing protein [Trichomonas vaginalis G3]EAX98799.1 AGC family protein kinase [Trichomonas vaginalis G3]KAI5526386.1 STKc MAST like domain-containing protein [Trichomonas vaginalis G3]|eukprot:XP_001311729.1 AGC family protein kinase [Trichomonas vaginalis G3]